VTKFLEQGITAEKKKQGCNTDQRDCNTKNSSLAFFANNTANLPEIADHMAKYVIRMEGWLSVTNFK
jgi:hypothetical protein